MSKSELPPRALSEKDIDRLMYALEKSIKLQSHYAGLLNMYDGGERMTFDGVRAWMSRLDELENSIYRKGQDTNEQK